MGIESITKRLEEISKYPYSLYHYDETTGEYVKNDPNAVTVEDRINSIVDTLKQDDKYKNFSEDELIGIARNQIINGYMASINSQREIYLTSTGKPMDPTWGQFTYDEILGMANNGVFVPQEFLDWANAMAASDTTSYELESDASSDSNVVANLEVNTDDKNDLGKHKKLQKYSSKAEKQEELLLEKSNELQQQGKDINAVQDGLENKQKMTLDKINKISKEFNTLSTRAQSGEALTDSEIRRYNELGLLLNAQGQELVTQSKNVEGDLQQLISELNGLDSLIKVNKDISGTLESMSLNFAGNEGGKRHSYLPSMSGLNTFGTMESFAYAARGQQISSSAGMIGVKLNFDSDDLQFRLNTNAAIAEVTLNKVQDLKLIGEKINPDETQVNETSEPQEEVLENTEETEAPEATEGAENAEAPEVPESTEGAEVTEVPEAPEDAEVTTPISNEEQPVPQVEDNEPPQLLPNKENQASGTVEEAAPVARVANSSGAVVETEEPVEEVNNAEGVRGREDVQETDDVEETEDVVETADAEAVDGAEEPAEEEDPLEVAAKEYLEGCKTKNSEMQIAKENVKALRADVQDIKKSRFSDLVKAAAQFKNAFKQYSNLLDKVKKGKNFSAADQAEFLRLNSILDSNTGSIAVDMQSKIATLNEYTAAVETVKTAGEENLEYGEAAIQTGKDYAKQELGDRRHLPAFLANSKKAYDLLYGKSGESLGRDLIDNGEALVKQAATSKFVLMANKSMTGFAADYSAQLSGILENNNSKVSPLTQEFNSILAAQGKGGKNPASENGSNDRNDSNNQNNNGQNTRASKASKAKTENASADDVNNVENKGKKADDQAKEAKKADKQAVRDKKQCDREIKQQQVKMKNNTNQIRLMNKENELANAQILNLNMQAENELAEAMSMIAESKSSQNEQAQPNEIPVAKNMNAVAKNMNAVTKNSNSTQTSGTDSGSNLSTELAGKVEMLGAISQQSQKLGLRVTANGEAISVIEKRSIKSDKRIAAASKAKYEIEVQRQKEKEQEIKDNQKLTKTVSDIGKVFTATKLAGMGLMLMPWSAAAGLIMFNIGKYGEIATYVTNAAINVAQGNLLGAAINIGAAALSFLSAPPASAAAKEGVAEAAKKGAETVTETVVEGAAEGAGAEVLKTAGAEAVKTAGAEAAKTAGAEAAKTAGAEAAKTAGAEAAKAAGTEAAKTAGTEAAKTAGTEAAKTAGTTAAKTAGTEAVKTAGTTTAKTAGTEAAKTAGAEATKTVGSEAVKTVGTETVNETTQAATQSILAQIPAPALDVSVNISKEAIDAVAQESMKKITAEMAKAAAKELAKENLKTVLKNVAIEAGKSVLLQYGEKLQQKDTVQETKRKAFVGFERQKRDAMKRGIEKIKKSHKAR